MKAFFYNILTSKIFYMEDQEILELGHNLWKQGYVENLTWSPLILHVHMNVHTHTHMRARVGTHTHTLALEVLPLLENTSCDMTMRPHKHKTIVFEPNLQSNSQKSQRERHAEYGG
jgi:hypothetical protein